MNWLRQIFQSRTDTGISPVGGMLATKPDRPDPPAAATAPTPPAAGIRDTGPSRAVKEVNANLGGYLLRAFESLPPVVVASICVSLLERLLLTVPFSRPNARFVLETYLRSVNSVRPSNNFARFIEWALDDTQSWLGDRIDMFESTVVMAAAKVKLKAEDIVKLDNKAIQQYMCGGFSTLVRVGTQKVGPNYASALAIVLSDIERLNELKLAGMPIGQDVIEREGLSSLAVSPEHAFDVACQVTRDFQDCDPASLLQFREQRQRGFTDSI
jgi:hypothetical protein